MKRPIGAASPFSQPAGVSEYPPRVRAPFVLVPRRRCSGRLQPCC